jgi:microsomal dipeptidase-like Zn-dependent dipeptidase
MHRLERVERMKGFADIHAHPMAHLAFGGHLIWGRPDGPFAQAFAPCDGTDHAARSTIAFVDVAKRVLDIIVHDEGKLEKHPRNGYPTFEGWPTAGSIIHQQMHVDWLRRAYDGGLRVLCALAVNNRLLGWLLGNGRECWDDESVLAQLAAMRRVAEKPRNRTWMQIAYCADDAERIVHSGKLAIVLGAEVDEIELFLGHDPRQLALLEDEARLYLCGDSAYAPSIEALAQTIYDAGIRQITPIHFMDNAFGGAALYNDRVSTNIHWLNLWRTGRTTSESGWPAVVAGPADLESRLQRLQFSITRGWSIVTPPWGGAVDRYGQPLPNHINARGLTAAGEVLLLSLWRRGVLVDIDHMSLRTKTAALSLAEQLGVPVISSHACLRSITLGRTAIGVPEDWWSSWDGKNPESQPVWPWLRNEGMRSDDDLVRIDRLGGIAAPLLRQPAVRKPKEFRNVLSDGAGMTGTTTAAAAAYLHIVGLLGSKAAVAIGTDINGLAQLPIPSNCCLPTVSTLYTNGLARTTNGERVWDINADGVAHYGMLPDLILRWRAEGMPDALLAPLFRSAQGYVETLARAEAAARRLRLSKVAQDVAS